MNIFHRKFRKRFGLILANSANTLFAPIFNLAISLLVIRLGSATLWGEFVSVLIVINLANHVIFWGNKDYVLREISRAPGSLAKIWQSNLLTRLLLFGIFAVALFLLPLPFQRQALLLLWGFGALLYQSFDALVIYRRKFLTAFALETVFAMLLAGFLFFAKHSLNVDILIAGFGFAMFCKALGMLVYFRKDAFAGFLGKFERNYFQLALLFFLLGLSGMLQSRTDLYCVAWFLPDSEVARYQVLINWLIYVQVIASLILQPFLKNIYRLPLAAVKKIAQKLLLTGMLIVAAALPAIYFMLKQIYQFEIAIPPLLWGGVFVLPIFYYLPTIYVLYKQSRQRIVLHINIFGILANLCLTLILIKPFGITGALAASGLAQVSMLIAYVRFEKNAVAA